jgi:SAM-dependent methyltransferase
MTRVAIYRRQGNGARSDEVVSFDPHEMGRHGPGNVFAVCWRQWWAERALRQRGILFRTTDPASVEAAYSAMSEREFEEVNGRQSWANWRTIPRSISSLLPDRPWKIVDLGCGTGDSTRVLAWYAPRGSTVIGYEVAAPLVRIAKSRHYHHRSGWPAEVSFCCQSVSDSLRLPKGTSLPAHSIDLVNASGVVGHHLNQEMCQNLGKELKRVLCPGGIAALDVGRTLRAADLCRVMEPQGFERIRTARSSIFDQTGQVVFRAG